MCVSVCVRARVCLEVQTAAEILSDDSLFVCLFVCRADCVMKALPYCHYNGAQQRSFEQFWGQEKSNEKTMLKNIFLDDCSHHGSSVGSPQLNRTTIFDCRKLVDMII